MALATSAALVLTLAIEGQTDDAHAEVQRMVRKDGSSPLTLGFQPFAETRSGDPTLALIPAEQSFAAMRESSLFAAILAYALSAAGQSDAACQLLEKPSVDGENFGNSNSFACWAWLRLDKPHRALEALQHGFERRCPYLPIVLRDPAMAPIADDRVFRDIFNTVFPEQYRAVLAR